MCGASQMTVGHFVPQIWLGNEFRGLAWYADNDRGWTPIDGRPAQEVVRDGHTANLLLHLIQEPVTLNGPRTMAFVLQPTPNRPLQPGWRMLNVSPSQSFMSPDAYGRSRKAYKPLVHLDSAAAYAKSLAYSKTIPGSKGPRPTLNYYFSPHTESYRIMSEIWGDIKYFGPEWQGCTYAETLNDHLLWHINQWIEKGGLQGFYHDQFYPTSVASVSSDLAYFLPDGRVQPGFALTTRRRFTMREHALWMEKGIIPPRTLTHTTHGGPIGCLGWVEHCKDGEDKRLNRLSTLDFADTWPSDRIRAGSLSYNWGVTYDWMRLIDETGMTPEQKRAHRRAYFGHVFLHDCANSYDIGRKMLLDWGLDDDRVFYWPFWSNSDVVRVSSPDVKVSAWTLPNRVLLCAFNYGRKQAAECEITVDLAKMDVDLPADSRIHDLEKAQEAVPGEVKLGKIKATVGPRDYVLISLSK